MSVCSDSVAGSSEQEEEEDGECSPRPNQLDLDFPLLQDTFVSKEWPTYTQFQLGLSTSFKKKAERIMVSNESSATAVVKEIQAVVAAGEDKGSSVISPKVQGHFIPRSNCS